MMRLFLVRHGETTGNERGVFYGSTDLPLTPKGITQSSRVAGYLTGIAFDAIYTSQLQRAQQTAQLIAPASEHQFDPSLNELDFGRWEMCHYSTIAKESPQEWQNWLDDWQNATPGGGEPFPDFAGRINRFSEGLESLPDDSTVLIVAHQGVLSLLLASWLKMPVEAMWHFPFKQDAYTVVENRSGFYVLQGFNNQSLFQSEE